MNLTWLVPKWPFPADDGAKQANAQLLRELSALGYRIHLCAFVEPGDQPDLSLAVSQGGITGGVTLIRRDQRGKATHLRNLLRSPLSPLTVAQFGTPSVAAQVEAVLAARPGIPLVYDGLHCAGWRLASSLPESKIPPSYYRAHNVEKDIWVRAAQDARNPLKKAALRLQAYLLERFERQVLSQSKAVFPVSEVDTQLLRAMAPSGRFVTLPIGIRAPADAAATALPPPEPRLLFVGRLDWPPNRDGLRWVLEKVWPEAVRRRPELKLDIVGSGDGTWLKDFGALPGVALHGRVESVVPYYRNAAASLVPVFYGSGTRVKAIESCLLGRVCLGTAVGVEGIGLEEGKTYFRAESQQEWIDALTAFDAARAGSAGQLARAHAQEVFDPARIARKFAENIGGPS